MSGDDEKLWRARFPELFRDAHVDYADCDVRYTTVAPPDELVSRLHLVAVTPEGDVVVCRSDLDHRFLPGGTREPGESLDDLARRELLEEAGAVLLGAPRLFSAHAAHSRRAKPFRPHLPHPWTYWCYAVATVQVVSPPTNPADGETVVEVCTLSPDTAATYVEVHDRVHADVIRHATALGLLGR